ncbi:hypothetical protein HGM15179_005589 [Zosterops borbonicus]|uniref:Uncharacterized protein n=1 Tax=Zosterops borbonicus TaxID=364589 RepID=A0A8K1GNQ0_9PASS|nr:hypothetical protein HGM15179_005589 [Zosterops borbonicus]
MEQLQVTKPMCWIPLKIPEKVALQDYPLHITKPMCWSPLEIPEKVALQDYPGPPKKGAQMVNWMSSASVTDTGSDDHQHLAGKAG